MLDFYLAVCGVVAPVAVAIAFAIWHYANNVEEQIQHAECRYVDAKVRYEELRKLVTEVFATADLRPVSQRWDNDSSLVRLAWLLVINRVGHVNREATLRVL